MAVENVANIESVETDMNDNTVTVAFDDENASIDDVVKALNDAGYMVPEYSKAN